MRVSEALRVFFDQENFPALIRRQIFSYMLKDEKLVKEKISINNPRS